MNKTTIVIFAAVSLLIGLGAACSTSSNTATSANQAKVTANSDNTSSANAPTASKADEDAPAAVKAAFPGAQSFTKQHKDIPAAAIADIEKDSGAKVPDTDHHSYLAFSTEGGARKQVGAATQLKVNDKDLVVVYENKEGSPVIKEVRGEGVPTAFLSQFAGKGHDSEFKVGKDLKANGVDDATAKAIAQAVQIDALTMQNLYGAAHSH
ncbi:MAG: hypothetical protein ACR2IH_00645 [Pyrinomonadaceae bacterium]